MHFLLLRAFPGLLMLGGVLLLGLETRAYLQESGPGRRGRWLRRALGASLLCLLAGMIYCGQIPDRNTMPPGQLWLHFQHWLVVLVVAMSLMVLAAWDAVLGVRHLRGFFEDVERDELHKIQQHLKGPPS